MYKTQLTLKSGEVFKTPPYSWTESEIEEFEQILLETLIDGVAIEMEIENHPTTQSFNVEDIKDIKIIPA